GFAGLVALYVNDQQRHRQELIDVRNNLALLASAAEEERPPPVGTGDRHPKPAAPSAPVGSPPTDTTAVPAALAEPKAMVPKEVLAAIDATFQSQRADLAWAREAERTARDKLAQDFGETVELRSVECRTSICRFETVHDGARQYNEFFRG